jgi:cyclooctat-9-en-7-ol 5-monooxygenase
MSRSPSAARAFFRDPVGYVRADMGDTPVTRLSAVPSDFLVVRDPETVWQVLVGEAGRFRQGKWKRRARRFLGRTLNTLDGEEHQRRRRLLQPSLDRTRIATFTESIVSRVERLQAGWEEGARLCLRDDIDRLSLVLAGDVLLSTDLEAQAAELTDALSTVMGAVPRLRPPIRGTRAARALSRVDRAVGAIVDQRRRSGESHDDLVGALLTGGLPERTVRGELIAFLLAAVDEPPSALEAAWYLLGRHATAEDRFHAELDAVLGDRAPILGDETRLPYLDAVVRETLRLFPPARHIDRCPVADVTLGDARFSAGANVVVSPLVIHREDHLYERASAFVPDRWLVDNRRERTRGAYLPFGAGAHVCIGQALARSIIVLTLATIGRSWRLAVDPAAPAPAPRAPRLMVTLQCR